MRKLRSSEKIGVAEGDFSERDRSGLAPLECENRGSAKRYLSVLYKIKVLVYNIKRLKDFEI